MPNIKSLKLIDWCFIAFVALYLAWSLWSLAPSKTPWYDEVVFASITDSFVHGNGCSESCYGFGGKNTYGPVYFLLTALSTSIFGFNSFGFRIVEMAAFFGCAFLLLYVLKLFHVSKPISYIGVLLFLTNHNNVQNAYSARMEHVAIFFILSGYIFYILSKNKYNYFHISAISLAFTLAALTTPRSIVLLLPLSIYIALKLVRSKQWLAFALYAAIPIVSGGAWIIYEHGSFAQCIAHYFGEKDFDANGDFQSYFLGGNCRLKVWHIPLLLFGVLSVFASITKKKWENFIFIAPVFLYFTIISDNGSYTPYGHVFLYLTCMVSYGLFYRERLYLRGMAILCMAGCIAINLTTAATEILRFVGNQPAIHGDSMETWVHDSVVPGSIVLADDAYFYALRKNNCTFRRLSHEWYRPQTYHKKLESVCKPIYILKQDAGNAPVMDFYQTELVATYKDNTSKHFIFLQHLLKKLGLREQANYSGKLYRIVRPEVSANTRRSRMTQQVIPLPRIATARAHELH